MVGIREKLSTLKKIRNLNADRGSATTWYYNNEEDMQVISGDASYYIFHIIPTNHDFIDSSMQRKKGLNQLKGNVNEVENNNSPWRSNHNIKYILLIINLAQTILLSLYSSLLCFT